MRPLMDMDTIQIELTNSCLRSCSNCTRFCGHQTPFFLSEEKFKEAVDSMVGYPKMTGFMGGEPLLHPKFEEYCEYALTKIPKEQLGLWTGLPEGYEYLREVICNTFGHIFINDHSRMDIFHQPLLIAAQDVIPNWREMFYVVDKCWIQNSWSAAINPKGAFFCEMAASMAILFDGPEGWPVEPGWWWRVPKDFREQVEEYCPKCGAALPLVRRCSLDGVDDISLSNLERLKGKSKKIARGEFVLHTDIKLVQKPQEMAAYKDPVWRQRVADRYGIYLFQNEQCFHSPILKRKWEDASNPISLERGIRQECSRVSEVV